MEQYLENLKKEKRSTYLVQIRKENNEKIFAIKRNNLMNTTESLNFMTSIIDENINMSDEINDFLLSYEAKNVEKSLQHLYNCRKKITNSQNKENLSDIDQIINKGMLLKIVEILDGKFSNHPSLLQEASWCVSNMAGSTGEGHVVQLVKAGAVNAMINLFINDQNYCIIDNCLYFFGNLVGDDLKYRTTFLYEDFLVKALNVFELYKQDEKLMKNFMWFLFCISRGKPYPSFAFFKRIFHILKHMISSNVIEIINYTLTILIHASDGDELAQLGFIINTGLIPSLLGFLKSKNDDILTLTLKLFNNLSYGADSQTRVLVDANIVTYIYEVLKMESTSKSNKRIAAFTLSNIMCSEPYQLQKALENIDLINLLIEMIHREPEEIVKECIICFTNSTFRGTHEQICFLIQNGTFNIFLEYLTKSNPDFDIVDEILQAIMNILNMASVNLVNGRNLFKEKLEQLGFISILDHMQMFNNPKTQKTCLAIVDKYFDDSSVFQLNQMN